MCLLALFFRVVEDAPVVVGANREENYQREGTPPRFFNGPCRAIRGIDPIAGGTWLGINQHGLLVAVTNRPKSSIPEPRRSRGLLAMDLLGCSSALESANLAGRELGQNRYAGCNFLCVDRTSAYVLLSGDWLRVRPLPPGLHVLTAHDVNDANDRRLGHALWWLNQRRYFTADHCLAALKELCSQQDNGDPPMCLRGEQGGTLSSSLVALRRPPTPSIYLHAQGPPDQVPYKDYSDLMNQLFPKDGHL